MGIPPNDDLHQFYCSRHLPSITALPGYIWETMANIARIMNADLHGHLMGQIVADTI